MCIQTQLCISCACVHCMRLCTRGCCAWFRRISRDRVSLAGKDWAQAQCCSIFWCCFGKKVSDGRAACLAIRGTLGRFRTSGMRWSLVDALKGLVVSRTFAWTHDCDGRAMLNADPDLEFFHPTHLHSNREACRTHVLAHAHAPHVCAGRARQALDSAKGSQRTSQRQLRCVAHAQQVWLAHHTQPTGAHGGAVCGRKNHLKMRAIFEDYASRSPINDKFEITYSDIGPILKNVQAFMPEKFTVSASPLPRVCAHGV